MNDAILMEEYFQPGFKLHPLLHVGSQTLRVWHDKPEEQAYESLFMVGSRGNDVAVVRDIDPEYIDYWKRIIGQTEVINILSESKGAYLTEIILANPKISTQVQNLITPEFKLFPFLITELEQKLADQLKIPLYGSLDISNLYGTKVGIRQLANEENLPMAPGFICDNLIQIEEAIDFLEEKFEELIIKHTLSAGGYMSLRKKVGEFEDIREELNKLAGGKFEERQDMFVVEGWIKNKASLCAQIEIPPNGDPIVCAGWQQILDKDGISYIGAGPLRLSKKALDSFIMETNKLANALKKRGAVGSFGPDYLVVSEEEKNLEPDTCVLVELNARAPVTARPLEAILGIRGKIGEGFCSTHIKLSKPANFSEIAKTLSENGLLIESPGDDVQGVVPFNPGMMPYKIFDIIALAPTWDRTETIVRRTKEIFER